MRFSSTYASLDTPVNMIGRSMITQGSLILNNTLLLIGKMSRLHNDGYIFINSPQLEYEINSFPAELNEFIIIISSVLSNVYINFLIESLVFFPPIEYNFGWF